jgi:tetratricopeptide (TPR) repeat protein
LSKSLKKKIPTQPTLSLCMIVKNEEQFLGQCLESVQDVVEEMIIVDTGSTDNTVAIAERYGAKVFHHPWQGSFSEARNYGLQFAKGDWILQMDADEELEKADIPILKKVLQSDLYDAIFVALLNDSPEGWTKHYFQRIFRRGRAHYESIVHNQLVYKGADLKTEIRIYHWGYNLSEEKMAVKMRRTEDLLLKQLEEDETNPFSYVNYLRVLRAQKRYDDAVQAGEKALNICRQRMTEIHRQMIAYDTAYCALHAGQEEKAEQLCRGILDEFPENIDILFTLATVLVSQKKYRQAIEGFHRFLDVQQKLKIKPQLTKLIIDTYNFDHKAWGNISDCYYELKEYEKALKAAENAVAARKTPPTYQVTLARALLKLNRVNEARKELTDVERTGQPNVLFYLKWAALCKRNPELGDEMTQIELGLKRFPHSDELLNYRAYALQNKNPQEAEKEWRHIIRINPDHVGALVGLAKIAANNLHLQDLEYYVGIILNKADSPGVFKEVAGYCLHVGLYQQAIELFSKYLAKKPNDVEVLTDVATCYAKQGHIDAAVYGFQAVLGITPENSRARDNLLKLMKKN